MTALAPRLAAVLVDPQHPPQQQWLTSMCTAAASANGIRMPGKAASRGGVAETAY